MTIDRCEVCDRIDPTLMNTENAAAIGVSEASIRRHKAANHNQTFEAGLPDPFFDVPNEFITSRGKSIRTGYGWEKVTFSPAKAALAESLKYDDLARALDNWVPAQGHSHTEFSRTTSVLNVADLQIGKGGEKGGGTPETLTIVRRGFDSFGHYVGQHRPEAVVLADGGDIIENVQNTPQQKHTNDLPLSEQIRVARRLMLEGIKRIAPLVPVLYYVAVPSNHGAVRTGLKEAGGTIDADFGLEISYQLEDAVRESPYLDHVQFVRPEPLEATAVLETSGTKIAWTHGDLSSGFKTHGDWWADIDHGRLPGWDADILSTSHYHSMRIEQSGDGRWIISNASPDPGSGWYSRKSGQTATRGMTAYDIHDGLWSNLRLV